MTRTKLAFVGFVAAGNSMWHQVLDDLCLVVTDQSATTWDSSYAPNSTQYQLRTTKFWKVLPQYYSVLQSTTQESTTPVLLQYYSVLQSTTSYYKVLVQYYKVLLQYFAVLQSTSPVLLRTAKYYSSTTSYYKGLLQYYFVLQSTTPVLQSTSPVLLPTKYDSSTTKY